MGSPSTSHPPETLARWRQSKQSRICFTDTLHQSLVFPTSLLVMVVVLAGDVTDAGVLVEVPSGFSVYIESSTLDGEARMPFKSPETISSIEVVAVAKGNEGPAEDVIVEAVNRWQREVRVEWVGLEPLYTVN